MSNTQYYFDLLSMSQAIRASADDYLVAALEAAERNGGSPDELKQAVKRHGEMIGHAMELSQKGSVGIADGIQLAVNTDLKQATTDLKAAADKLKLVKNIVEIGAKLVAAVGMVVLAIVDPTKVTAPAAAAAVAELIKDINTAATSE